MELALLGVPLRRGGRRKKEGGREGGRKGRKRAYLVVQLPQKRSFHPIYLIQGDGGLHPVSACDSRPDLGEVLQGRERGKEARC